jgi:hypothetical protein
MKAKLTILLHNFYCDMKSFIMFIVVANRMSIILVHLIGHSSMEEFHTTNGKTVSCDTFCYVCMGRLQWKSSGYRRTTRAMQSVAYPLA